jgi:hypothetical protein
VTNQVEFLYRYRSLRGYSREDVERILAHGQTHFPSPAWFNDPFDCKLPPRIDGTETDKRHWLESSFVPTTYPKLAPTELALKVKELMPRVNDLARQHVEYTQRELVPNSGVLCFNQVGDDLLMWSHYADSHRGICLKFRRSALKFTQVFKEDYPEPYQGQDSTHSCVYEPAPVDYADSVPTVNLLLHPFEAWGASVFTKSTHWLYEREWRVLVPPSQDATGHGWHPLLSDALAGVIFGCEINREDEQQLREWLGMGGAQVSLFRAERKHDRFELEIRACH